VSAGICNGGVEQMRRHGKPGHLINVSSMASEMPFFGAYGVSKIALEHLGETRRHELERDDIRITTIIPAGISLDRVTIRPPLTLPLE
jgi:NAD(P)-dependent dehydrogenase (short-subunit alcohol dehydrogenase family)